MSELRNCDVPYCENKNIPTIMFDDTNIVCIKCKKFTCDECTTKIWKGEWTQANFHKPKYVLPGLLHEIWTCPHCRASFDRFRRTETISLELI